MEPAAAAGRYDVVPLTARGRGEWWTRRWLLCLLIAMSTIPLIGPALPPLVDLPGHLAMYHIELNAATTPSLARVYGWRWEVVGNLGAELLVWPLGKLLGLEPAVKLIVLSIPALTVLGLLLIAREAHGAIPPTAFFALPLAYGFPFQFGFVNYTLSVALMLLALGLWMRLARLDRPRLRCALFVPGMAILFLTHSVGWAMTGLAIGGVEIVAARRSGRSWPATLVVTVRACLPLLPSALLLLSWLHGTPRHETSGFGRLADKGLYIAGVVWNGWPRLDLETTVVLYGLVLTGMLRRGMRLEPRIGFAALLIFGLFLAMPQRALGSFFADMRIIPYAIALALVALAPLPSMPAKARTALAIAGLALYGLRLAAQTQTYAEIDRRQAAYLPALDRIAEGARVFAVTGKFCSGPEMGTGLEHLSNLAVVRRNAFVNGVWTIPSGQLVTLRDPTDRKLFYGFTSEYRMPSCRTAIDAMPRVMATLRHNRFDYLWLIRMPPALWPRALDLVPVWRTADGILYRVVRERRVDVVAGSERVDDLDAPR